MSAHGRRWHIEVGLALLLLGWATFVIAIPVQRYRLVVGTAAVAAMVAILPRERGLAALSLAMSMHERMHELGAGWRKLGHKLGFGVGISLGYATVGMVGFEGRYDYTANGSVVNLAARLCDEAGDGEILLSTRAHAALEERIETGAVTELTLKGFHEPVEVFRFSFDRGGSPEGQR